MATEPIILHSDLNCFYASVEMMLDPRLRGKAVAVCGATEDRHGIVLAKSELAKRAGVKTGMVNWEAKQRCPDLILVPPQYEQYLKYSKLAHEIYYRYTDMVEPFGMDECWLDCTGSRGLYGDGPRIADEIRTAMREELGLTVSIGVSYNKIFAKLGSDMKKPDAVTVITSSDFKEKVWPLPASDLLYVGRATTKRLECYGIHTIGDIAEACILTIQEVAVFMHDEELAAAGVGILSAGHGEHTAIVMQTIGNAVCHEFTLDAVAGATHAGAVGAAALDHEAGNNAVENEAVVIALVCKRNEVINAFGSDFGIELANDLAAVFHFDGYDRIAHNYLSFLWLTASQRRIFIVLSISRAASRLAMASRLS